MYFWAWIFLFFHGMHTSCYREFKHELKSNFKLSSGMPHVHGFSGDQWSSTRCYDPKNRVYSSVPFCDIYCLGFYLIAQRGSELCFIFVNRSCILQIHCCCRQWSCLQQKWFVSLSLYWEDSNPQNPFHSIEQAVKQAYLNYKLNLCVFDHIVICMGEIDYAIDSGLWTGGEGVTRCASLKIMMNLVQ